jgi:hypothetical protein
MRLTILLLFVVFFAYSQEKISDFPFETQKSQQITYLDSVNNRVVFRENQIVSGNAKTRLMTGRAIALLDGSFKIVHHEVSDDKILFLTTKNQKTQVWISNGEKDGMKQIGEYDGSVVYDVYGKIKIYKLKNDFFYLIQQSRSYTVVKVNMTTQTATEELKFVGGFFYVTKTDDAIVIWINSAEYPFIAYLSSTKSYLVDIKEFDSFYLYAAENLYLTAHKKAKGRTDNTTSLYKLSVDSLTFVQEGLNSYYLNKNRLYFTNSTYNQAQQVISQQDIMYFDESSILFKG